MKYNSPCSLSIFTLLASITCPLTATNSHYMRVNLNALETITCQKTDAHESYEARIYENQSIKAIQYYQGLQAGKIECFLSQRIKNSPRPTNYVSIISSHFFAVLKTAYEIQQMTLDENSEMLSDLLANLHIADPEPLQKNENPKPDILETLYQELTLD